MSIRDLINQKSGLVASVAVVILVVSLGFTLYQFKGPAKPEVANASWYSTDDGASWFKDKPNKMPFEVEGKPAYRAYVFDDGSGKPFVGYLERYSPQFINGAMNMFRLRSVPMSPEDQHAAIVQMGTTKLELKRAGRPASEWIQASSAAAQSLTTVAARSGGPSKMTEVLP